MIRKQNKIPLQFRPYLLGKKVLDVGGGSGKTISQFVDDDDYVCFDNDPDVLGSHTNVILGDITQEWFIETHFDTVVFSHILEHLTHNHIDHVLISAKKLLSNGGAVVLLCPSDKNKGFWSEYTHVRPHNTYSLRGMLKANGFKVVSYGYFYKYHPYKSQVWAIAKKQEVITLD